MSRTVPTWTHFEDGKTDYFVEADEKKAIAIFRRRVGDESKFVIDVDTMLDPLDEFPDAVIVSEGKVECDDLCDAWEDPITFDEYKKALRHWREHGYLNGCSHAC